MQNDPSLGLLVLIPGSYLAALGAAAISDLGVPRRGAPRLRAQAEPAPLADPTQPPATSGGIHSKPKVKPRSVWRKIPLFWRWGLFLAALAGFGVVFAALGSPDVELGCSSGTVATNAVASR